MALTEHMALRELTELAMPAMDMAAPVLATELALELATELAPESSLTIP
jgi:hypothetical protein